MNGRPGGKSTSREGRKIRRAKFGPSYLAVNNTIEEKGKRTGFFSVVRGEEKFKIVADGERREERTTGR